MVRVLSQWGGLWQTHPGLEGWTSTGASWAMRKFPGSCGICYSAFFNSCKDTTGSQCSQSALYLIHPGPEICPFSVAYLLCQDTALHRIIVFFPPYKWQTKKGKKISYIIHIFFLFCVVMLNVWQVSVCVILQVLKTKGQVCVYVWNHALNGT